MRWTRRALGAAALFAIAGDGAAHAQDLLRTTACLHRAEAEALAVFVLPTLIDGVARKCRPALPANATLPAQAATLAARYRPEAIAAWPEARVAFARLSDDSIADLFGDEVTRTMIDATISSLIIERVAIADCAHVDAAVEALTPLPARNVGKLVTVVIDILASKGRRLPIALCEDSK